jgi:hypothetical protein
MKRSQAAEEAQRDQHREQCAVGGPAHLTASPETFRCAECVPGRAAKVGEVRGRVGDVTTLDPRSGGVNRLPRPPWNSG